ncbi:MAG TPA: OsmC family protein [Rhizomicrobium sp.]|nr:OsmC family protein [Rhizomicrobium sp.]
MSEHHAGVRWKRTSADFTYASYDRAHEMVFKNGGTTLAASATPAYKGDADRVDPEEAFVASLSSCHMLTFLAICALKKIIVESYDDAAVGFMEKGGNGKMQITRVVLHPVVRFADGANVTAEMLADFHHQAHDGCFIANSVTTDVTVAPRDSHN